MKGLERDAKRQRKERQHEGQMQLDRRFMQERELQLQEALVLQQKKGKREDLNDARRKKQSTAGHKSKRT